MRDIGYIEDRVENLEKVTSLSLLELNTQTLQIKMQMEEIDLRVDSLLMILKIIL